MKAASHTHLWSGQVSSCEEKQNLQLQFQVKSCLGLKLPKAHLNKCEVRSSPQLGGVVGGGGHQKGGVGAELTTEGIPGIRS